MENILNLVRNLQTGEIKLLRHFYRFQEDNESKKINLLFELAVKSKNSKKLQGIDKKIHHELYGSSANELTFAKLKCRLKNDMLNILLLQTSSPKFKAKHDLAIFECRRMLLQAEILLSRGIYDESLNILERACILAQKNELFEELILIEGLCRNYNLLRPGERSIAFMKRIENNTALLEKVQAAKYLHYEMVSVRSDSNIHIHSMGEWKERLETVKRDHEQSGSVKVGFYYYLCALYFSRESGEFDRSLELGLDLLEHGKSNEIVRTSPYTARIHAELAKCYLLTGDHEKALQHAGTSNRLLEKDVVNELAALEIILYCSLASQDYKNVYLVMEKVFPKLSRQSDEFTYAKWHFFKAGVEFRMNEHRNALQSLKKCDELLKDKSGWLLAYNLFEVICRIENGNLEWFENRAEALRKMMQRYNKNHSGDQNKRFHLIYLVLRTLHKNNYDYARTLADEKENLALLAETNYLRLWHLNGFEPVQFDAWLVAKAEGQTKNKKPKSKLVA